MFIAPLIAAALSVSPQVNPIDPTDPDVVAVSSALDTPDFAEACAVLPDIAFDVYLSPAFAPGEADLASDMVVAYFVELFEEGYGANLSEDGEQLLEEAMYSCILDGNV